MIGIMAAIRVVQIMRLSIFTATDKATMMPLNSIASCVIVHISARKTDIRGEAMRLEYLNERDCRVTLIRDVRPFVCFDADKKPVYEHQDVVLEIERDFDEPLKAVGYAEWNVSSARFFWILKDYGIYFGIDDERVLSVHKCD